MHVGMKNIRIWNNGSLEVSHIQPNDVGDYLCEVITTDGRTLHQEHTIQIQCKPSYCYLIDLLLFNYKFSVQFKIHQPLYHRCLVLLKQKLVKYLS